MKLGAKVGRQVIISDEIAGNGRHDPDGTIYINPKTENAARVVLFHELTHDIETSGLYEKLSESVVKIAEEIDGLDVEQYKDQLREIYGDLAGDGIDREAVASIASERLFDDERMVNRLFQIDQTLFTKIKNWLSDMKVKFFGTDYEKMIRDAEKLYIRAMETRGEAEGYGKGQNFIAYDNSNQPYWKIEDSKDIFKGITNVNSLKKAAFNFILHGYKGGENITDIIDGKPLEFRRVSANEFVYGVDSKGLNERPYKQKMRMATSVLDLIDNAFIHYTTPDWKNHPKFSGKFENYQGRVGIDNNIFKYIVRIGKTKNGNVFYDINLEADGEVHGALRHVTFKKTPASKSNNTPSATGSQDNPQSSKGSTYTEMLAAQREKLQKNGAKTGVTMTVDDWVGMAKNLVETSIGTLEWKDPARALDKVAGRNRRIRNELYELIEKPIHESQGKYAANLKEKAKSMTDKFSELGIKAKSKESKAVQWIGEGQREIGKTGETEEYTLTDLQHDFPEKWQDIKAAADYCREVYDQYLKDLNDMYSEIYPATKEAAEDQVENYREAENALRKKEKDGPLCFAKQAVLLMAIDYLMLLFS